MFCLQTHDKNFIAGENIPQIPATIAGPFDGKVSFGTLSFCEQLLKNVSNLEKQIIHPAET